MHAFGRLAFVILLFASAPAAAQPASPEQHTEEVQADAPEEDVTKWDLSFGGVVQTGNTQAYSLNGGSLFELVRGRHGVLAEAQGAYGSAVVGGSDGDYEVVARNLRLRLRYDFFLTRLDAIFVAGQLRHDPFAGLDYRAQGQLGYARYFLREEDHRFWAELGYDLTYDDYDPDPLIDPDTMMVVDGTDVVHSARFFVGYDNAIDENLQLRTGLEVLMNVEEPSDLRLAWDSALRSKLAGRLQLEIKLLVQYDNEPVPGNEGLDTTTQINLIFALL